MSGGKTRGRDIIVYMSNMNESFYIPIFLTICLCLAVGNDLVKKSTRLLKKFICFISKFDPNNSQVKKNVTKMCLIWSPLM